MKQHRADGGALVFRLIFLIIAAWWTVGWFVHIDLDIEGYRPEPGKLDRAGNEVEDRIYNPKDFDRIIVIDPRTDDELFGWDEDGLPT